MVITLVSEQFNLYEGIGGVVDEDSSTLLAEGPITAGGVVDVAMQRPAPIVAFLAVRVTRKRPPLLEETMKCLVCGQVSAEDLKAGNAVIDIGVRAPVEIRGIGRDGQPLSHGKAGVASMAIRDYSTEFALDAQGVTWILLQPGSHMVYVRAPRAVHSRIEVPDMPAHEPIVVTLRAE
jgi:hypothetical protein